MSRATALERAGQFAGFAQRFGAYVIDVLPIMLAVGAVFWFFFGFDEVYRRYLERQPGDLAAKGDYMQMSRMIRNISGAVYVVYAAILESSPMRATVGKRLAGLEVVDLNGERLSFSRAFSRNASKTLSGLALGLGFLWIIWSKRKQGWHDSIAGTIVRYRQPKPDVWETTLHAGREAVYEVPAWNPAGEGRGQGSSL